PGRRTVRRPRRPTPHCSPWPRPCHRTAARATGFPGSDRLSTPGWPRPAPAPVAVPSHAWRDGHEPRGCTALVGRFSLRCLLARVDDVEDLVVLVAPHPPRP